jgi:uncharacterized protein
LTSKSAAEWIEHYNLALVQGLLMRSELLTVEMSTAVRSVVRYAKLCGLLTLFEQDRDTLRMHVSGPLTLFRNTLKYGRVLANFFPAVCVNPGYRVQAQCRLTTGTANVVVQSGDPIARSHVLPREVDSAVERALVADIRRVASPWQILRETVALHANGHVFFPDFTLQHGRHRVLVEIVGFYTQEYLDKKFAAIASANVGNLILCIGDKLPVPVTIPGAAACLRYKRRVDARALLALADSLTAYRLQSAIPGF